MSTYCAPEPRPANKAAPQHVYLMANGDLRLSANQNCWAAQDAMERDIIAAVEAAGWQVERAHPYKEEQEHGFIGSQREGLEVFRALDPDAPLIVAEAVWQYSHHILHGLTTHRGPILTLANWSGTWPGLVGMLNLNGSLTKAGVAYSTLWADDFGDAAFREKLGAWLSAGRVKHAIDHVTPFNKVSLGHDESKLGRALAGQLRQEKAIMGVFDEGCMGMFNAIIPDHLLNPTGVFKERLSQS
ncbi:MAG: fucose isomerase, partial [Planctomycetales bacterium]|nr:fucose isomerase [Planctomycetales bacterium]